MGKLDNAISYMIGPIDYAHDKGIGFRQEIKELTNDAGLLIRWLDPTDKLEGLGLDVGDEQDSIDQMKRDGDWVGLQRMMKHIVHVDLWCVDRGDFNVGYIDKDIHMCGSYHEIIMSTVLRKPTLVVIEGGRTKCPSWIFGICKPEYMFDDIPSMVSYLKGVNDGTLENEWLVLGNKLPMIE